MDLTFFQFQLQRFHQLDIPIILPPSNHYSLIYIERGGLVINNLTYPLHQIVLFNQKVELDIQLLEASKYYVCQFQSTTPFLHLLNQNEVYAQTFEEARYFIDELQAELEHQKFASQTIANQIITNLFIQTVRRNQKETTSYANRHKLSIVNEATTYINDNLCEINVQELSKALGLSPNYLYKLFMDIHNISIQEYILKQKINQSISMLKTNNYTMKEIAELLNFSSQNHFSNTFKRYMHITPTNYRKKIRIF